MNRLEFLKSYYRVFILLQEQYKNILYSIFLNKQYLNLKIQKQFFQIKKNIDIHFMQNFLLNFLIIIINTPLYATALIKWPDSNRKISSSNYYKAEQFAIILNILLLFALLQFLTIIIIITTFTNYL